MTVEVGIGLRGPVRTALPYVAPGLRMRNRRHGRLGADLQRRPQSILSSQESAADAGNGAALLAAIEQLATRHPCGPAAGGGTWPVVGLVRPF